jgi:threonine/homoserine/homoserine lactone efflux protein
MLPIDPSLALAYIVFSLALTLSPGPDTLFVIANGMRHRVRGAVAASLGICTGCLVHAAATGAGMAAILATSAHAFDIVRFAGACYLLYLGIKAIRSSFRQEKPGEHGAVQPLDSLRKIYCQAIITNLFNPKVLLFYMAFLPQFIDPSRGHAGLQMFILALMSNMLGFVYLVAVGALAGGMSGYLTRRSFGRWLDRVAGVFFIDLAVRLAVTGRPQG